MKKFVARIVAPALAFGLLGGAMGALPASASTLPSGYQDVNDTSPLITYNGTWKAAAADARYTGSTTKTLASKGSATFTFTGAGIRVLSRTTPWSGKVKISVDGGTATQVDLYSAKTTWQKAVYEKRNLSATSKHTVKVEWAGSRNFFSSGSSIELDALQVLDNVAPPAVEGLKVESTPLAARVSWLPSTAPDLKEYVVTKAPFGTTAYEQVSPAGFKGTSFDVFSVEVEKKYQYRVTTVDMSGNSSVKRYDSTYAPTLPAVPQASACPTPTVTVTNNAQLAQALSAPKAGDVIKLAGGTYSKFAFNGTAVVGERPSAAKPIWLCGTPTTVINAGTPSTSGNGLTIAGASYLNVAGLNLTGGHRGIQVSYSDHVNLVGNTVKKVGLEAIHLMNQTVDSAVAYNTVEDTGLHVAEYGEGIYVGTSSPNWDKYNNGLVDTSDRNVLLNNTLTRISAECVDVKTGTKDGIIKGNICDVASMGERDADAAAHTSSFIAVRGDSYLVDGNRFVTSRPGVVNKKLINGVQIFTSSTLDMGGRGSVVRNNVGEAGTKLSNYGVAGANPERGNFAGCTNTFLATPLYQFGCQL